MKQSDPHAVLKANTHNLGRLLATWISVALIRNQKDNISKIKTAFNQATANYKNQFWFSQSSELVETYIKLAGTNLSIAIYQILEKDSYSIGSYYPSKETSLATYLIDELAKTCINDRENRWETVTKASTESKETPNVIDNIDNAAAFFNSSPRRQQHAHEIATAMQEQHQRLSN